MSKLSDLSSRIIRSVSAERRMPVEPKLPRDDSRRKPTLSCQSLCLNCDARTPCSLGRMLG